MAKPLTEGQLQFLRHLAKGTPAEGTSRGLVRRGLISHRWGSDPTFGYKITAAGRRALADAEE
jgi:hypothetical protein